MHRQHKRLVRVGPTECEPPIVKPGVHRRRHQRRERDELIELPDGG
jgi:hypothetical protein